MGAIHTEKWWLDGIPKIPDDAYYYYQLAENFVRGLGFTMDGVAVTNGFQPLWMAVILPLFGLDLHPVYGRLPVIIALNCLIFGAFSAFLFDLLRRLFRPATAWIALALLCYPRFNNVLINGMESGLTTLMMVLALRSMVLTDRLTDLKPRWRDGWVGFWLRLTMLGRLDSVFLLFAVAFFLLFTQFRRKDIAFAERFVPAIRKGFSVFWPVLVLVVPYLAANTMFFGSIMPISGAVKSTFPNPGFHGNYLLRFYEYPAVLGMGLVGLALLGRFRSDASLRGILFALMAGQATHLLFTLLFMKFAVQRWHFVTFIPVATLAAAGWIDEAYHRLPRLPRWLPVPVLVLALAFLGFHSLRSYPRYAGESYFEAAAWTREHIPANARMAMHDSGTFSYLSRRQVVNLDGIVNDMAYQDWLCAGRLDDYLRQNNVAYLVRHIAAPPEGYKEYTITYYCRKAKGLSKMTVYAENEVFRGTPYYHPGLGKEVRLMIWRLPLGDHPMKS